MIKVSVGYKAMGIRLIDHVGQATDKGKYHSKCNMNFTIELKTWQNKFSLDNFLRQKKT